MSGARHSAADRQWRKGVARPLTQSAAGYPTRGSAVPVSRPHPKPKTQSSQGYKRNRQVDLSANEASPLPKTPRSATQPRITEGLQVVEPDFHFAIDLGTTNTTVAYHTRGSDTKIIHTIDNFPGEQYPGRKGNQIPTALWYPIQNAALPRGVSASDTRVRFGNEVTRLLELPNGMPLHRAYDNSGHIDMMKLLLDKTEYTKAAKRRLQSSLKTLKELGHIERDEDVLCDILCKIMHSIKTIFAPEGLTDDSNVEIIFCVPVCWSPAAVNTMCAAVEYAMKDSRLGTDGKSPCNIFVVHEAEAQAMHTLTQMSQLTRGETFILMDCGGGTTDVGIYHISVAEPLRLAGEVNEATGAMVGAGDLNARFIELVKETLANETYLESKASRITIGSIVETDLVRQFENGPKRTFSRNSLEGHYFQLRYLRESKTDSRIVNDGFMLTREDMWEIFEPTVTKIGEMMLSQIGAARQAEYRLDKVVIVGGFGDSPCLREHLSQRVKEHNTFAQKPIELIFMPRNMSATGVATGAILRSLNKADGPSRIAHQSIGVLQHIPCDRRGAYPHDVLAQEREQDDEEGVEYVYNTIKWLVKKGTQLDPVHDISYKTIHSFPLNKTEWIVEEYLYASETSTADFYKIDHPKNVGKVIQIGHVEFDITLLRAQTRAQLRKDGQEIDDVTILFEMKVIDRNIELVARWPAHEAGNEIRGSRVYFSVVSAFQPGTQ